MDFIEHDNLPSKPCEKLTMKTGQTVGKQRKTDTLYCFFTFLQDGKKD
jgi:hypothetical protein